MKWYRQSETLTRLPESVDIPSIDFVRVQSQDDVDCCDVATSVVVGVAVPDAEAGTIGSAGMDNDKS